MNDVLLLAITQALADGDPAAADALEKLAHDPAELNRLLTHLQPPA